MAGWPADLRPIQFSHSSRVLPRWRVAKELLVGPEGCLGQVTPSRQLLAKQRSLRMSLRRGHRRSHRIEPAVSQVASPYKPRADPLPVFAGIAVRAKRAAETVIDHLDHTFEGMREEREGHDNVAVDVRENVCGEPDVETKGAGRGDGLALHVGDHRVERVTNQQDAGYAKPGSGEQVRRSVEVTSDLQIHPVRTPEAGDSVGVARPGEALNHEVGSLMGELLTHFGPYPRVHLRAPLGS